MAVAQESEFLAVNQKIRVRIPAVTPFHNARDAEIVEAAACKPALTRCESGRALHFGAIVQEQDDAMALRRSGCDSPWLHHLDTTCPGMRKTAIRAVRIGETLGAAPRCPTISNSAKALVATHAAGIGERPVQLRLADRFAL